MLSIKTLKGASASDAAGIARYPDEGRNRGKEPGIEDYYVRSSTGRWLGQGARRFGLAGEVREQDLVSLLQGFDPRDGHKLTQNAGTDRERVMAVDLTLSAPKSVSALWALGDADMRRALERSHTQAVERAVEFYQRQLALSSRGHGRAESERAGVLIATYQHASSREAEPDLHNHSILLNIAVRHDGTTGAVDMRNIYDYQHVLGAMYRAELAARLQQMGLAVERDRTSFKVAGVPQDLCDRWSTRRKQIVEAMSQASGTSAASAEAANLSTRRAKEDLTQDELNTRWQDQAREIGITRESLLTGVQQAAAGRDRQAPEQLQADRADDAALLRRMTEHEAVFDESDVWKAVAFEMQTYARPDEIEQRVHALMADPELVRLRHPETGQVRYTTREILKVERGTLRMLEARAAGTSLTPSDEAIQRAISETERIKGFALSTEQQAAVRTLLAGASVQALIGHAGAGKSASMTAVKIAVEQSGGTVVGLAPSAKAARELQKSSGIQSDTIHRLLYELEQGKRTLGPNTVIVLDEAGMADARIMYQLAQKVRDAGCRLMMCGDTAQLSPVGPGRTYCNWIKGAGRPHGHGAAELTEVRRHKLSFVREAAEDIRRGKVAEALGRYLDRGLLHVEDDREAAIKRVVERWARYYDRQHPGSTLVVTNTNAERIAISDAMRDYLKSRAEICNLTPIQALDREGNKSGALEIGEGDRLKWLKNDRAKGLMNNDLMTVERIDHRGGRTWLSVRTDDGERKRIDATDGVTAAHAWALTTHASQGSTVEHALVFASGGKGLTNRNSMYVQMSRSEYETEAVLTRDHLEEIAETAEPTAKMVQYAQSVAERRGLELPDETTFAAYRNWLNQHTYQVDDRAQSPLADVRDLIAAMSREDSPESTLDYQIEPGQDGSTEAHEEPEPELTLEPEAPEADEQEQEY